MPSTRNNCLSGNTLMIGSALVDFPAGRIIQLDVFDDVTRTIHALSANHVRRLENEDVANG